jgi:hypothetical protein
MVSAAVGMWRRKRDPEKDLPLQPSSFHLNHEVRSAPGVRQPCAAACKAYRPEFGATFHSCASALAASDKARFSASTVELEKVDPARWTIGLRFCET